MDAEVLALGIVEAAKREREKREAQRRKVEEENRLTNEFNRRRTTIYTVLARKQSERLDEAVEALIDIGNSLNPYGADFWACEILDDALRGNPWPRRHFAFLIAKTAFFDLDKVALKSLLATAIDSPELEGVGQYLTWEFLELFWARSMYEEKLPNGNPNLEATPFTTVFSTVGEFAEALKPLTGFSRETLNRRLKSRELITLPAWTKNSTEPHRFKFCDVPTQRAVLAHLRANRTSGTMLHTSEGGRRSGRGSRRTKATPPTGKRSSTLVDL